MFIRTLVKGKQGTEAGRSIDTVATPASTSEPLERCTGPAA